VAVKQGDDGTPPEKRVQGLTPESFDALLAQLDPDREKAGELYETIRRKLVRLFEWRGCASPEDLADVTFNRVARRLAEGVKLQSANSYGYFCGVAHLVYKEVLRSAAREHRALESGEWPPASLADDDEPSDERLECLRHCLQQLPADQRNLVLRYHQGENNIRNRQTLADEMGIPMNALRIRVHRVRRKLETCVHGCLSR
jgi:DNA-directed RNA polymerase specialized sigma24 family protein